MLSSWKKDVSRIVNGRAGLAVLVVTVLAVCVCVTLLLRPSDRLPYNDRFADGRMDEWVVYGGSWQIAGAVVSNNSDDAGSKIVAGSEGLTDYVMNSDVSLTSSDGDTGIMVRVTNPEVGTNAFNGYYVGIRLPDALLLGKMDYGYRPLTQVRIAQGVMPYVWYHLTVMAKGCTLTATAYDAHGNRVAATSFEDQQDCDRHGAFGLRSFAAGGSWRGVSVEELR
jgi:hypothetical protein